MTMFRPLNHRGVGWHPRHRRRSRVILGSVTAMLTLATLFVPIPLQGATQQPRDVVVIARRFAFEPGIVQVNHGDKVVIRLESVDVVHGLYIDGYALSTQAEPGRPGQLTFTADRAGAFRMRCSVACGPLHPFMIGKLEVGPNLLWARAVFATVITALGALATFWRP